MAYFEVNFRYLHALVSLGFIYLIWNTVCVFSFNIETNKPGILTGQQSGSQFGYSVAVVKTPGWAARENRLSKFHEKTILVGAPNAAVNLTSNRERISGHGQVHRCAVSQIAKKNISCRLLNTTEPEGKCMSLRMMDNSSACETGMRMGSTIAVNRKFDRYLKSTSTLPMVTVCAPGWKNTFAENNKHFNLMIGMCLKMRNELNVLKCSQPDFDKYGYCWPFWPSRDKLFDGGRPIYTYAQAGMSASFSSNGDSEVIGAPGVNAWRGAYKYLQLNKETTLTEANDTSYYGYAIATGNFDISADTIIGSPNYHIADTGYLGQVELRQGTKKVWVIQYNHTFTCGGNIQNFDKVKTQTGTKFGASIATIDITKDNFDEIFVGAPFYSDRRPDEGRVFVYTTKNQRVCGPIGILSGGVKYSSLRGKTSFARFGTSIASAGDLDKDGFNDVAIGAPYEDDGHGAVYIYLGLDLKLNDKMEDRFAQRIEGKILQSDIKSFGWSLYGDEDLDGNEFPDLVVGAYASDTVAVFRSRPTVNMTVELSIQPTIIPLNATGLSCSRNSQLCMEATVMFFYTSQTVNSFNLSWDLSVDTLMKAKEGYSRFEFRDRPGENKITETISVHSEKASSRKYIFDVKMNNGNPEPKDAWTKVRLEGWIDIVNDSADVFEKIDPLFTMSTKRHISEDADFDKKCESLNLCQSNLDLKVDMSIVRQRISDTPVDNTTEIYVTTSSTLRVTVDVRNIYQTSYRTNFTSAVDAESLKDPESLYGDIGAKCISENPTKGSTNINCSAEFKLDLNKNIKVVMHYDISQAKLIRDQDFNAMQTSLNIFIKADQANYDTDASNNVFSMKIPIKLKYAIVITVDGVISDQVRYKADRNSEQKIRILHRYYVINEGPSFSPRTNVTITIPVKKGEDVIAVVDSTSERCTLQDRQIQTTIGPSTPQSTKGTTIVPPNVERRRRETGDTHTQAAATDKLKADGKNITCAEYECVTYLCKIPTLEAGDRETINVQIDIFEKELAKEKEVRVIRYATTAVVTDPHVLYGGKVVQWDHTVYAEKWTTLRVEPNTLEAKVELWIIIVCIVGGLLFLALIMFILYKCGFFKRKKHSEVQKWKTESLYKRRSQLRMSSNYKQIDGNGEAE